MLLCVFLSHKIVHSIETYPLAKHAAREEDVLQHELTVQGSLTQTLIEMIPKYFKRTFMFLILLIGLNLFCICHSHHVKMFSSSFQFDTKQLFWFNRKFRLTLTFVWLVEIKFEGEACWYILNDALSLHRPMPK